MSKQISYIIDHITELTKEDKNEVYEFLEHDEWGIALETLCTIVSEENILITEQIYDLIRNAGEVMEMDTSIWQDLKHLIA